MNSLTPNGSASKAKVVYIDQKCWINIAKIYYGESSECDRELVDKIIKASDGCNTIFPLSMTNLDETSRISNPRRKHQLASLMVKISKGYSFSPFTEPIIKAEILNVVLKKLGRPTIDISNQVLGRGIAHLLGVKPEIVRRNGTIGPEPPENIKKKMLDLLNSPETLEFALTLKPHESIRQNQIEGAEQMEQIRQRLLEIKDNDFRRRVFLANNVSAMITPKLAKILIEMNLPKDFIINEKWNQKDILEFLDSIPTALCLFTLIFQRDQQLQRPIQVNDINDVWFLTLAIPYSDIVVTERMWASISRQAKLDKKCNTIILSSIKKLSRYL